MQILIAFNMKANWKANGSNSSLNATTQKARCLRPTPGARLNTSIKVSYQIARNSPFSLLTCVGDFWTNNNSLLVLEHFWIFTSSIYPVYIENDPTVQVVTFLKFVQREKYIIYIGLKYKKYISLVYVYLLNKKLLTYHPTKSQLAEILPNCTLLNYAPIRLLLKYRLQPN